jgi:hypothetical protein
MAVDHKAIPDAELHPPKGFSLAANNTVLTRTSGTPTWKTLTAENLTNNSVTAAKLATGSAESTWVGGVTAGLAAAAVGSYVIAIYVGDSPTNIVFGDVVSGSTIYAAAAGGTPRATTGLPGTWRCMGGAGVLSETPADLSYRTTLWLRVS